MKTVLRWLVVLAILLIAAMLIANARQSRQSPPTGYQSRPLRPCQPPPAKVAQEDRAGRVIVDARCDDRGGIYLLTKPK